jgi:hypothetical protein
VAKARSSDAILKVVIKHLQVQALLQKVRNLTEHLGKRDIRRRWVLQDAVYFLEI